MNNVVVYIESIYYGSKYEVNFCPSINVSISLFRHFLGIGSLVFPKFWHCVRNPYELVLDRGAFFPKNRENEPKMGQK